jgi:hypothetical protein
MSDVKICSNALLRLGAQTINSLDERTDRAKTASNLWPSVKNMILRGHDWNCAKRRVLLAPQAEKPAFDWKSSFLLPGDWVRNVQIGYSGRPLDYLKEGKALLANADVLPLVYISDLVDSSEYDKQLTQIMELAMAHAMAYAITKSTSVEQAKSQELEAALRIARNTDAQDEPAQTLGDFPIYASRF